MPKELLGAETMKGQEDVSVALCTYNGHRFLAEQLESIASQDCLPNELIVCDDCSGDGTVHVVRQFARTTPFPVRLEVNPRNLGCTSNFDRAIGLCRGQLIVLADQDDIWLPSKILRLRQSFSEASETGLAFSDALLVDAQRRRLPWKLWQTLRFSRREQDRFNGGHALNVLLRRNVVTGATMAFRAKYREIVLPIPAGWMHDAWIALIVSAVARCRAVPEALIEYRQHPPQQIGASRTSLFQQYQRAKLQDRDRLEAIADGYTLALERILRFRHLLLGCATPCTGGCPSSLTSLSAVVTADTLLAGSLWPRTCFSENVS
jgi:glycosyltransferase involved in cell wall biosynthesis